ALRPESHPVILLGRQLQLMLGDPAPMCAGVVPETSLAEHKLAKMGFQIVCQGSRYFDVRARVQLSRRRSLAAISVGVEFLSVIGRGADVFVAHDALARSLKSRPPGGLAM